MKHLKKFESYNLGGWIIPLDDKDIDPSIFEKIPDIREKVKEGDIVIGVWFSGGFDAFILKLEDNNGELGAADDESWYGIDYAWGIFDPDDYDKYTDKKIGLTIAAKKYNL